MTEPNGAAPMGAAPPRGTAAASELVEVYKILHHAGKPLTVPEIADQMPKGYLSAAMNAYRGHKEQIDPTWLEGKASRWSAPAQREAMLWWVRRIVKSGVHTKKLSMNTKPVQNMYGIVREGTYTPGRVPKVRRRVWVEKTTLADWSPEDAAALNQGHTAGMQFVRQYDALRTSGRRLAKDTKELLDLAERAIRPKLT